DRHGGARIPVRADRLLPLVRRAQPCVSAPERAPRPRLADVHLVLPRGRAPVPVAREPVDASFADCDHSRLGAGGLGAAAPSEVGRRGRGGRLSTFSPPDRSDRHGWTGRSSLGLPKSTSSSAPLPSHEAPNAHAETHWPISRARGGQPTHNVIAIQRSARPMMPVLVQWNQRQNAGERVPARAGRLPSRRPKKKVIRASETRKTPDAAKWTSLVAVSPINCWRGVSGTCAYGGRPVGKSGMRIALAPASKLAELSRFSSATL